MQRQTGIATAFSFLALLFVITVIQPVNAAGLIVNTNADNTTAGDGFCTLREAITNANTDSDGTGGDCAAGSGADVITFAGNYIITLGSSLPDLFTNITITGNGPANTIVQSAASAGIATYRVFRASSTVTLEQMTVRYGVEASGGGINNASGTLTLNYVVVRDNMVALVGGSSINGGGISTNGGNLILNNSAVINNQTTLPDSTARGNGGGIFSGATSVTINNSTISGNSAANSGGGIYVNSAGTINLRFSTVTNNTSNSDNDVTGDGGGIGRGLGTFNLNSSIVAGNKKGTSSPTDNDCTGTITSQDYNLTGSGTGCTTVLGSNDITVSPSAVFTTVIDSPLADNGGATQSHALLAGSPAIDTIPNGINSCGASPFDLDQRNNLRPTSGNCDSGAYEYPDVTAPTVDSFTATSPSTSLNIPITAFTASDATGVTGYLITESSTPPSASAAGWAGAAPATYAVASDGAYTLYPWVKDAAGNVSAVYGTPASVIVETTAPSVLSSTRANASPTNQASVQFSVTFAEPVTGVNTSDFSLTTSGVTGASVTSVSGSGATRTVAVSTGSGSGTIRLDITDDDTIMDSSGNPLGGSGAANGNFSTGEFYTIDRIAPTAGSLIAADITTRAGTTYSFTVTFSDNLAIDGTSVDDNDIRVTGSGGFNQLATLASVTPGGAGTSRSATYQITAPGGAWDSADNGTYTVAVEAHQIFDSAGNSVAATSLGSFLVSLNHAIYLPLLR